MTARGKPPEGCAPRTCLPLRRWLTMGKGGEDWWRGKTRGGGRGVRERDCRWILILKKVPQCGREVEWEVAAGNVWVVTDTMWQLALLLPNNLPLDGCVLALV